MIVIGNVAGVLRVIHIWQLHHSGRFAVGKPIGDAMNSGLAESDSQAAINVEG